MAGRGGGGHGGGGGRGGFGGGRGFGYGGRGFGYGGYRGFGYGGYGWGGYGWGGYGWGGLYSDYGYGGYDYGIWPGYFGYGSLYPGYTVVLGASPVFGGYASGPRFIDYYASASAPTTPSLALAARLGYTDYYAGTIAPAAPAVAVRANSGYTDYYASSSPAASPTAVSKRSGYTDYYAGTAPAASGKARIHVRVPADAVLWLDGKAITQTGEERDLLVPDLKQEKTCEVKARWVQDGRTVEQTLQAKVRANETTTLDFRAAGPGCRRPGNAASGVAVADQRCRPARPQAEERVSLAASAILTSARGSCPSAPRRPQATSRHRTPTSAVAQLL